MDISVDDLLCLKGINIVDIRSVQNYNNNHIPGAVNIRYNDLLINYDKYLDKDKKYYIYCNRGYTSKRLCLFLRKLGYDVYNVVGGYEAWVLGC